MTHTLALEIDYAHEHGGWIDCDLIVDGEHHPLDASDVFPPFLPLLHFAKAVASQRLPAEFIWDEEGHGLEFKALPVAEGSSLVHLTIQHWGTDIFLLDAEIERDTVLRAFLPPLQDLAWNFTLAEAEWGLPRFAVRYVVCGIAEGFPLGLNDRADERLEFQILGDYSDEAYSASSLHIWLGDERKAGWHVQDTDPFWPEWIGFLEKIASGDLPARIEHVQESGLLFKLFDGDDIPEDLKDTMEYHTHLQAEPVDAPQDFRLSINTSNRNEEIENQLLDELFNRRLFVQTFRQVFEKFLQNEYQLRPDVAGQAFDLRTLSLDKLA
jgi:hypothetical protein